MKKSVIGLFIFVSVFVVFSAVGVYGFGVDQYQFTEDFKCEDFGIECGFTNIQYSNGTSAPKSCGTCFSDSYCYFGKCIKIDAFGPCERPASLDTNCDTALPLSDFYGYPGQPLSQRLEALQQACENYGCTYNSETQKCTGTIPPCSYFREKACTQNDNEEEQSELNEQTGICTTTWKNFPITNCELFNGQWDEETQSCTFTSDLTCLARDDRWGSYYCRLRNVEEFTPDFLIYRDSLAPTIRDDGVNIIWLSNDDLENIKNGENISINIKLINSGLPPDTPITIQAVSGEDENKIYIQREQIQIDTEGKAVTQLMISQTLLSALNYNGFSSIRVSVDYINEIAAGETAFSVFSIMTSKGSCSGIAKSCSEYSQEVCLEIARFKLGSCTWDYNTNSCNGGQGVSCTTFDLKESCHAVGCKWKANSILERFIDWVKSIFGG